MLPSFYNMFVQFQEITVRAHVSGSFIVSSPIVLDFGICVFDSVYRDNFELINNDSASHKLQIKLPSKLRRFLTTNIGELILQPGESQMISLRFTVR